MDALVKALELGARYAWAAFFVSAFVLFIPNDLAQRLDLLAFRRADAAYLWLVFIFTGTLILCGEPGWRYVICPLKKLLFPVRDFRSKIKQSRIRYYRVQFLPPKGDAPIFYQGINSNGTRIVGFFDDLGKRVVPPECGYVQLDNGRFQLPKWGKIDWEDVFNGKIDTGMCAIAEY